MQPTHAVTPEEVMAYLDGELSLSQALRVRNHLEQCVACTEISGSIQRTSSQLASWKVEDAVVSLPDATLGISVPIRPDINSRRAPSAASRLRVLAAREWIWASAVLLLLGVVGIAVFQRREPDPLVDSFAGQEHAPGAAVRSEGEATSVAEGKRGSGRIGSEQTPVVSSYGPRIARTATLSIFVKDFVGARNSLDQIVAAHQGYLANLKITAPNPGARSLDAQVRVPSEQLPLVLAELKAIGKVEREEQGGEDVGAKSIDFEARIKNAREEEEKLQQILQTRTGRLSDVLEVEREESRVRGEIEQMEADQKALETRVVFAEISLAISQEYHASLNNPLSVGGQLRNAMIDGFRDAGGALLSVLVFLLNAGPSLLILIAALFWPARRCWRRLAAQNSRSLTQS